MSQLLGADTRRVDAIAAGLHGYSEDVQDLRTLAQRAVCEMREAWDGGDFESIAQRWEQETGARLGQVASSLAAMVVALRSHTAEQRLVSGPDRTSLGARGVFAAPAAALGGVSADRLGEGGGGGGVGVVPGDADALLSVVGGSGNAGYELSAGKVEATAGHFLDVDDGGNIVASASASVAAYLGYAAASVHAGGGFARAGADGTAFVGATVRADASGSIGASGAAGHLGAAAFAGGKAVVTASGTIAGAAAAAGAEISYGIGAHADVDAELSATGVGASLDVGATLGLGAGVMVDLSVNPQEVIELLASIDDLLAAEAD